MQAISASDDDTMVCSCGKVTKGMIVAAIASGSVSFRQLRELTGVDGSLPRRQ